MSVKTAFAKRLRELRGPMTQAEFAEAVGISRGSVSFYENEERTADIEVLSAISEKFNVSVDYLLGKAEIRNTDHLIAFNEDSTGLIDQLKNYERDYLARRLSGLFDIVESKGIEEHYIPNFSRLLELLHLQIEEAFKEIGNIDDFAQFAHEHLDTSKQSETITNFVFGVISKACEGSTSAIKNQIEAFPPVIIGRLIDHANQYAQNTEAGDLK